MVAPPLWYVLAMPSFFSLTRIPSPPAPLGYLPVTALTRLFSYKSVPYSNLGTADTQILLFSRA